jgi:hypothetical protein
VNRIDLLKMYRDLVAAVERAINEADPIGLLAGGAPSDEYAPEIGTIIPLLANAHRPTVAEAFAAAPDRDRPSRQCPYAESCCLVGALMNVVSLTAGDDDARWTAIGARSLASDESTRGSCRLLGD